MTSIVKIESLGAQGDGIANSPDGRVFVPFALPGESIIVGASAVSGLPVLEGPPSKDRVAPVCRHFGTCGGCALQHLDSRAYLEWKRRKLVDALSDRAIGVEVAPIASVRPASRRRAVFSARRTEKGPVLGYMRAGSNTIVDIAECPLLVPAIADSLDLIRSLAGEVGPTPSPFRIAVTATASGLDIALDGCAGLPDKRRHRLSSFAVRHGLARLSVGSEVLVCPRPPQVFFGRIAVTPPPGGFLQACADTECEMARQVTTHLRRARKVIDLFSGCGSFALRLAENSNVHAVESDPAALAALEQAFRFAPGLKTVTTERRDLMRRPVTAHELAIFDGLVFDPPRAGAQAQARQIARSQVPYVVAVSCNPGTLARDLRILIDGGYSLERVIPLDQFLWSPHVEALALLTGPKRHPGR